MTPFQALLYGLLCFTVGYLFREFEKWLLKKPEEPNEVKE